MGGHLRHLPRYGPRLHGGAGADLHPGVAEFKNFILPLVVMAPIPLTLIGIVPGIGC